MEGDASFRGGFLCDGGDNGNGGLLDLCSSCISPALLDLSNSFEGCCSICLLSDLRLTGTGLTSSKSSTSTGMTALGMVSPLRTTGENIFLVVFTITSGETSLCGGALSRRTNTYNFEKKIRK